MSRPSPWSPQELAAMSIPELSELREELETRIAAVEAAISLRSALAPAADFEEMLTGV
ncbi:hypothetical protein ACH46F_32655 [Streptomyces virginiae]|uniref:hypothetical protein n=1 Tax=Streptomyces virginiae TaxID=1961 RepID=UPI0037A88BB0